MSPVFAMLSPCNGVASALLPSTLYLATPSSGNCREQPQDSITELAILAKLRILFRYAYTIRPHKWLIQGISLVRVKAWKEILHPQTLALRFFQGIPSLGAVGWRSPGVFNKG
jgi:hypothetical protein